MLRNIREYLYSLHILMSSFVKVSQSWRRMLYFWIWYYTKLSTLWRSGDFCMPPWVY